jgi:hypothetical protein
MARIRTIKPEFFTSEDIVALSPLARLLYIAMWCEADKAGRLVWKPRTFKLRYLPGDDCDVMTLCEEVVRAGLVVPYGDGYAYIPKFTRHQHINPRESESVLPLPERADEELTRGDASARVDDAQGGREGKGREGDSVAKATGGTPPVDNSDAEKRELYDAGKSLLAEQGMPVKQTGSYIAKLAKDYGQQHALDAVRSAVAARPMNAAEYLKAACMRIAGERKDPVTVPSDAAEKTAAFLAEQSAPREAPNPKALEKLKEARNKLGQASLRAVA